MINRTRRIAKIYTYKGHKRLKKIRKTIDFKSRETLEFLKLKRKGIAIILALLTVFWIFHYFGWWGVIGILFIKFGLGFNVVGVKTFGAAIVKIGGYKMFMFGLVTMIGKRYLIDKWTKFFNENSLPRYKDSLIQVMNIYINKIKKTKVITWISGIVGTFVALLGLNLFFQKIIAVVVQKFTYFVLPIITWFLSLFLTFLNNVFSYFTSFIILVLEGLALNGIIKYIEKWSWGRKISSFIDWTIKKLIDFFMWINNLLRKIKIDTKSWFLYLARNTKLSRRIFIWLALNVRIKVHVTPRVWLVILSNKFNKMLVIVIDKGIGAAEKIERQRYRYVNSVEKISLKREKRYKLRKNPPDSYIKKLRKYVRRKTNKRIFRERIELISERRDIKKAKYVGRTKKIKNKKIKRTERKALNLPYQEVQLNRRSSRKKVNKVLEAKN